MSKKTNPLTGRHFVCLFFSFITSLSTCFAGLPPVFAGEPVETYQADTRVRTYLPPTRIVWMENEELIREPELLLRPGHGQVSHMGVTPQTVFTTKDGKRPTILLDFGREIQGGLQIVVGEIRPKQPTKVRVRFGESVSEAMCDISPENGATNDHAIRDFIVDIPWLGIRETGNSGFRFVRIDFLEDDLIIPIQEIRAIFTYHDIPYLGSFRSSDPRLDSIWMVGAYTVHLNMQEYLWDGIKRDRLVWLGDMHPELRTLNAVFGDHAVVRRSLDLARDEYPLPKWMNSMCAYSLWWVIIHWDYYLYHGDLSYLQEQRAYMTELLQTLLSKVDADGREHLRGGRFLDWPTSEDTTAINAGLHALMIWALEAGSKICAAMDEPILAAQCMEVFQRMQAFIPDYKTSKQSAALNAIAGVIDPAAANAVLKQGGVERFSTFYGYYMLEAKARALDYAGAMENIKEFWGGMLDLGATSFWEDFNIKWLDNAARIDELTPAGKTDVHETYGDYCYEGFRHSFCHGWASGPTAWLTEHVLGLTILEPGCKTVKIEPNLGDLQWVEGTVPTPYGIIKVRHEKRANGTVKSTIEAPAEINLVRH